MTKFQTFHLRHYAIPRRLIAVLMLGLLSISTPAMTATPADVQSLIRADKLDDALRATETELAKDADNVEMRFLKGLILTRQDKLEAAAKVFRSLIDEHPKMPEPYNNLAVVYAAQGEYDKARETLLQAINTHPSYATAYENIGDIYAKMASDAYNQALELDTQNTAAREKLALVNDLFPGEVTSAAIAASSSDADNKASESATAAKTRSKADPPAKKQAQVDEVEPARPPAERPGPVITQPDAEESAEPAAKTPAPAAREPDKSEIVQTVRDWAAAWSDQDVQTYLDAYADSFLPPAGMSRSDWAAQRRERLREPEYIKVDIDNVRVNTLGNDHVQVRFSQSYQSNTYSDQVVKTLLLKRDDNRWQIAEEYSE